MIHITYITRIVYIIHITYITHVIYITHIAYINHILYVTHRVKLMFKAYKKTDKIFFHNIFPIHKNDYYRKTKKKLQKEARERYENFSEEEKDKKG